MTFNKLKILVLSCVLLFLCTVSYSADNVKQPVTQNKPTVVSDENATSAQATKPTTSPSNSTKETTSSTNPVTPTTENTNASPVTTTTPSSAVVNKSSSVSNKNSATSTTNKNDQKTVSKIENSDSAVSAVPIRKKLVVPTSSSIMDIVNIISNNYSFLYDPSMDMKIMQDIINNPRNYVVMYLDGGEVILIQLKPEVAPKTVRRFSRLVKSGFYNDMEFFRVIPNYFAQAGDPTSSGYGGSGKLYYAEINKKIKFQRGTIAMSNMGNLKSDDSQFFIAYNSYTWLDGKYTIFGEVVYGMDSLEKISASYLNQGYVADSALITKMEILSDHVVDSKDDVLNKVIGSTQLAKINSRKPMIVNGSVVNPNRNTNRQKAPTTIKEVKAREVIKTPDVASSQADGDGSFLERQRDIIQSKNKKDSKTAKSPYGPNTN